MAKRKRKMTKKLLKALRKNVKKARSRWMKMSATARQKAMPAKLTSLQIKKLKKAGKYYPIGSYVTIDTGRPKHHYIVVKKTKYGWEKSKRGLMTRAQMLKGVSKARGKWMGMSHKARAIAMPSRKRAA